MSERLTQAAHVTGREKARGRAALDFFCLCSVSLLSGRQETGMRLVAFVPMKGLSSRCRRQPIGKDR